MGDTMIDGAVVLGMAGTIDLADRADVHTTGKRRGCAQDDGIQNTFQSNVDGFDEVGHLQVSHGVSLRYELLGSIPHSEWPVVWRWGEGTKRRRVESEDWLLQSTR